MQVLWDPGPGETAITAWAGVPLPDFAATIRQQIANVSKAPAVVAIDGRGGAGKSSLANALAGPLAAQVLHTGDLAWNYSILGWDELLRSAVVDPLRAGEDVVYRPPGWVSHHRAGNVALDAQHPVLIVEGTGVFRRSTRDMVDVAIWMQGDYAAIRRRVIDRDVATGVNGDRRAAEAFWQSWQQEEAPFLEKERPWNFADHIVAGMDVPGMTQGQVAVGVR